MIAKLLNIDPWLGWFTISALALCIGSFVTVVVYRLPKIIEQRWESEYSDGKYANKLSLWLPPSHCHHCQKRLKWRHNIPLISCVFLRGRCAYCNASIKFYFGIELTTLTIWLIAFYNYGMTMQFIAIAAAVTFLVALTYIDLRDKILPDELTLSLLWIGLIANGNGLFVTATDAIYGAIAGYTIFSLIKWAFTLIAKKQGLGLGDAKLLAAIGAWIGWQALPAVVLIASLSGIVGSIILIALKQHTLNQKIAFGPYLACAALVGLLLPDIINDPFAFILSSIK